MQFKYGLADGLQHEFDDYGNLILKANWKDGRLDGIWEKFEQADDRRWDTVLVETRLYRQGLRCDLNTGKLLNGNTETVVQGTLFRENWKNGRRHGLWEKRSANNPDELWYTIPYENGKKRGKRSLTTMKNHRYMTVMMTKMRMNA